MPMRMRLLLGAPLLWCAIPATAQDLPTAMADALARSPSLAAAQADVAAAEARVAEARAAGGPTARLEGTIGVGRIEPHGFFGLTADDVMPRAAQAVAEYPLFTGGRVGAAVAQAQGGAGIARLARDATRHQLRVAVVAAYAEVLTARQLVESYTRLNATLEESLRAARLRFQVGDAASTEVAQARARLAEGQAGLIGAEGRLTAARSQLAQLTGRPVGNLQPLAALPALPPDLDAAIDMARADNAMRQQAGTGVEMARAGVRAARASNLPTVGAFAEAAHVRDQFFPDYRADSLTAGVRARWTFFDSGAGSARVDQAQAALAAAEARERAADDQVTQAVIEAWQGVATARAMLAAARDGASAAEEALRATRLEVRVGAKPPLAELDATREAMAAAARLAEAEGGLQIAAYRLRALTGME